MRRAAAFTALLLAVLLSALCGYWALSSGSASSAGGLACSVKASCDTGAGEVAVFRMFALSNTHAGTFGGSSYGNVVCCGGVAGLGNNCSGVYDTALTLSATDNAHVASDASYLTKACLSLGAGQEVNCTSGATCDTRFACLATISGTSNAHVADCNGVDDYATKVCCYAGPPLPVGGVAELPEVSGSAGPNYMALAGLAAAALVALSAGAWYARRRWNR
jgi:hypothetical protein